MNNKISDKDKKDWENFIKSNERLEDKDNKIIEGNPDKIKTVIDRWKFTRKASSMSPNWYLSEIKTN